MTRTRCHETVATLVAVLAGLAFAAHAADFINVLTGGTSGVYYPMGVALSQIYGKALPDAKVSVQATKASAENLNLLQAGRGEVAFTLGDSLSDAWKGDAEAGFPTPLKKLRGIAGIYPNYIQIVASADSGIRTLADLKGKRVSVGAPKSGTELNARAVLKAAGLTYKDLAKVEYLPFGESVELMKNRQLDVTLQSAGLGVSALRDLAASMKIVVVEIPADGGRQDRRPGVPAGDRSGRTPTKDRPGTCRRSRSRTFSSPTRACRPTRSTRSRRRCGRTCRALVAAHSAGKAIRKESALEGMAVPLHPGAEKYYREIGLLK